MQHHDQDSQMISYLYDFIHLLHHPIISVLVGLLCLGSSIVLYGILFATPLAPFASLGVSVLAAGLLSIGVYFTLNVILALPLIFFSKDSKYKSYEQWFPNFDDNRTLWSILKKGLQRMKEGWNQCMRNKIIVATLAVLSMSLGVMFFIWPLVAILPAFIPLAVGGALLFSMLLLFIGFDLAFRFYHLIISESDKALEPMVLPTWLSSIKNYLFISDDDLKGTSAPKDLTNKIVLLTLLSIVCLFFGLIVLLNPPAGVAILAIFFTPFLANPLGAAGLAVALLVAATVLFIETKVLKAHHIENCSGKSPILPTNSYQKGLQNQTQYNVKRFGQENENSQEEQQSSKENSFSNQ